MDATLQFLSPFLKVIGSASEEFENNAGGMILIGKCIGFVRIHMHGKRKLGTDADDDIRKDEGSLITFHDHEHLVIVFYIHLDSLYRRHVDVPFGHDDAVVQLDAALRAHQGTAGRVFRIPGLAYDSRNPQACGCPS